MKEAIIEQYIKQHKQEVDTLKQRIKGLQKVIKTEKENCNPFSYKYIKTDKKINFYTGITTIKLFDTLFEILNPYLSRLRYWQGSKKQLRFVSKKVRAPKHYTRPRKLDKKDEFLLT